MLKKNTMNVIVSSIFDKNDVTSLEKGYALNNKFKPNQNCKIFLNVEIKLSTQSQGTILTQCSLQNNEVGFGVSVKCR